MCCVRVPELQRQPMHRAEILPRPPYPRIPRMGIIIPEKKPARPHMRRPRHQIRHASLVRVIRIHIEHVNQRPSPPLGCKRRRGGNQTHRRPNTRRHQVGRTLENAEWWFPSRVNMWYP